MKARRKPYRILGAYDSETTNYIDRGAKIAFPILHQIGIIDDMPLIDIDSDNVENHVKISLFRHAFELYAFLDSLLIADYRYVPVICCHNLAFDMYGLADWLSNHNVRVLAKSAKKPITFTVLDESGNPVLVFWDTLVFSQKPLSMMGHECGYEKAVGEWDYSLIRTPETPLSALETDYACKDIYALIAWLAYWLRMNTDITEEDLAHSVVTKTGVIRQKRKIYFDSLRGKGRKQNCGRYQHYINRTQAPKTDDELFTMQAATRGGFTFCATEWASVPITPESGLKVIAYDATSQHPAQMVSKFYPIDFKEALPGNLDIAFDIVAKKSPDKVLKALDKPFPVAFNALFAFKNLRPKKNSLFEKNGIFPLASARFSRPIAYDEESESSISFKEYAYDLGYRDSAVNPVYLFGKLVEADYAQLWITELTAWEIAQCYEWDSVEAVKGYMTMRFIRPTDYSTLSVMQFYDAKDTYKKAMHIYNEKGCIDDDLANRLKAFGISAAIADDMRNGSLLNDDMQFIYLGLKADLNGLFGIEATNEYRQDAELSDSGIQYIGDKGICNKPRNPKAWYQFGQRIVGYSRIAQILIMQLAAPYIEGICNGDTDSVKFIVKSATDRSVIDKALEPYSKAIDKAKRKVCARVKASFPARYSSLDGIGHYVYEFEAAHFCASWNKSYIISDGERCEFTLAGIPSSNQRREWDLNRSAQFFMQSDSFEKICGELLGYNVTICHDITGLNIRIFPQWGEYTDIDIRDYQGNISHVVEPRALALFPLDKILNNTLVMENRMNYEKAKANNDSIDDAPRLVHLGKGRKPSITYLKDFKRERL